MPRPSHPRHNQSAGELAIVANIREQAKHINNKHLRLGIGDDCAILAPPPRHDLLVTTDFSLENRHFRRDWHSPNSIGYRTLARGLSDLAAMGAKPMAAFLSLALPRPIARSPRWMQGFLDGLLALATEHNVPLAGGDTSESPSDHILADIILLGSAPSGQALRRSTTKPGDIIYVTGSLGGAAAELAALTANPRKFRSASPEEHHPHLFPQPRLTIGQTLLRRHLATACIDVSDGLSTDLAHLCEESKVSAEINATAIPIHPGATLQDALHGGEDYELLFTAPPQTRVPKSITGVRITAIGTILANRKNRPQITMVEASGSRSELAPQGWQHLR